MYTSISKIRQVLYLASETFLYVKANKAPEEHLSALAWLLVIHKIHREAAIEFIGDEFDLDYKEACSMVDFATKNDILLESYDGNFIQGVLAVVQ